MPDVNDQILAEVKQLKSWLYGEAQFEGDIPQIKKGLASHNKKIRRMEIVLAGIIGSGALGGSVAGIIKLLGG